MALSGFCSRPATIDAWGLFAHCVIRVLTHAIVVKFAAGGGAKSAMKLMVRREKGKRGVAEKTIGDPCAHYVELDENSKYRRSTSSWRRSSLSSSTI